MATDCGKLFEKELEKAFRRLRQYHLVGWHRLTDTSAARGVTVGQQPSDYLLALPEGSRSPLGGQRLFFVEAKASEKYSSLTKSMMEPSQRGAIKFYRELLHLPYLVLFYSSVTGDLQVWDGAEVTKDTRIDKLSPLTTLRGVGTGMAINHSSIADHLLSFFAVPAKTEIINLMGEV